MKEYIMVINFSKIQHEWHVCVSEQAFHAGSPLCKNARMTDVHCQAIGSWKLFIHFGCRMESVKEVQFISDCSVHCHEAVIKERLSQTGSGILTHGQMVSSMLRASKFNVL